MKTTKSVFIIIIVLAITLAMLKFSSTKNNKVKEVPNEINLSPEVNTKQVCFIWNTEAGDKALLSMDIRAGNVIGEFNWLPKERDKKVGIFKGTISSINKDLEQTVNAFWETKAEGMTVTEEFKININDAIAHPGFGEMKDRGDGVYMYADLTKVDYSLNLQQTDCGDSAMD